jgi:hypothetical protein
MHEAQKLKEARYFLSEMHAKVRDPHAFVHCLSAFLSASRSPIQYALAEAETRIGKPEAHQWHNAQLGRYGLINFFKDERDMNIHVKPVAPKASFKLEAHATLLLRGSASYRVKFVDDKGQPVEIASPSPEPTSPPPPRPAPKEPEVRYEFADRPGEDILVLCESYLKEVEAYVKDGQQAGHVTP